MLDELVQHGLPKALAAHLWRTNSAAAHAHQFAGHFFQPKGACPGGSCTLAYRQTSTTPP
eukprot:9914689-Prorocentrum_lima.AAC.1